MNTQLNLMNVLCLMNIHGIYNPPSTNHNKILKKKNLFVLKQTLRMQSENIIMNDFNLHHFV